MRREQRLVKDSEEERRACRERKQGKVRTDRFK